jgi:SAM-dependent methyltransferase
MPATESPGGIVGEARLATQKTLQRAFGSIEPMVPVPVKRRVRKALPREVYKYIDPGWHRRGIGGMWEELGTLQFQYLVDHGLQPHHYLLDVGCGPLRGGWRFIEYLETGHYYGIDRRFDLIEAGRDFDLRPRGLLSKQPVLRELHHFEFDTLHRKFDFALAQSVFTHLSINEIIRCLVQMDRTLAPDGKFFATFYEDERPPREITDVQQKPGLVTHLDRDFFHYHRSVFDWVCEGTGLEVEYLGGWDNPRNQRMLVFTHRGQ